jgi:hypothetical protein
MCVSNMMYSNTLLARSKRMLLQRMQCDTQSGNTAADCSVHTVVVCTLQQNTVHNNESSVLAYH